MHIHRPKPLHGVHQLLTEIGVIVIGIVIALGAEQVVEWLHWREVVSQTREVLDRELAGDLGVVQTRIDEGPCIARRLAELKTVFRLHARRSPLPLKGPLGQPQFPHIQSSVWETAITGEGAAHMPLDLRIRYAGLYDALYWYRDKTSEESEAWSHLSQFDDQDVMVEQDWSSLRQWKARAQAVSEKVDANIAPVTGGPARVGTLFDQAAALGVAVKPYRFRPASLAARDALCRPML